MKESGDCSNCVGDVFGYGSGFAVGAAIGGFVGSRALTLALGSADSGTVLALLLLAGHVGGSLRVARTLYRRQTEHVVLRVKKM